ncbi:hypothetical protein [Lactobacillus sp. M0396]|uniref:hypothetical protein n=1 Tax=Lactobacillus sp. M0396 TaxID=2751030 RepID=UPI0018DB06F2|nr:hypothetical protein [Lactobacillus sp. M0396]MBI0034020.1 hypothetical protein [Lactobacillus sp. M0396]
MHKVKVLTITDISILNAIIFAFDTKTAKKMLNKAINFLNTNYPFMESLKANLLINQAGLQMQEHKFKATAIDLTRIKPMLKDLGQYNKLIVVDARIAICKKIKRKL